MSEFWGWEMSSWQMTHNRNTPEDVAAVELIFHTLTTGPVCKDGSWKVEIKNFSSIENIFHLALNVSETERKYSGKTTEVMTRITANKKGKTLKLIINGIFAVVEKKEDWKRERMVFKLRESGPTFSTRCPSKLRKSTSSPVIIRLSVNLKIVLASSQIMVKVDRQGPERDPNKKRSGKQVWRNLKIWKVFFRKTLIISSYQGDLQAARKMLRCSFHALLLK